MWLIKKLFYLLFPSQCQTCDNFLLEKERLVCLNCLYDLLNEDNIISINTHNSWPKTPIHIDEETCKEQKELDRFLKYKFYGKVPIKYCFSFFKFGQGSKIRYLIHKLKYENLPLIGEILGDIVGSIIVQKGYKAYFDMVIAVPLYHKKLKQRGYNQSYIIAKNIAKNLESQYYDNVLIKIIYSKSQTLMKNKWERWKNTNGTFHVLDEEASDTQNIINENRFKFSSHKIIKRGGSIKGKKILLVDDVITTGATLEACAIELINKGAKEVSIATVAYG